MQEYNEISQDFYDTAINSIYVLCYHVMIPFSCSLYISSDSFSSADYQICVILVPL